MFRGHIPVGIGLGADNVAGALALRVKHAPQLQEPRTAASCNQDFVEVEMRNVPFLIGLPVVEETWRTDQVMVRADEPFFPFQIARPQRSPETFSLDVDSDGGEIAKLLGRNRLGSEAPLRFRLDQAIGSKPRQGFANGALRHAEIFYQVADL